jgi:hypothetical protein
MPGGSYGYIAIHGVLAGVFFFALQRFGLHQSVGSSVVWGAGLGLVAAGIAWSQQRRH